jgi:hypothetical protein
MKHITYRHYWNYTQSAQIVSAVMSTGGYVRKGRTAERSKFLESQVGGKGGLTYGATSGWQDLGADAGHADVISAAFAVRFSAMRILTVRLVGRGAQIIRLVGGLPSGSLPFYLIGRNGAAVSLPHFWGSGNQVDWSWSNRSGRFGNQSGQGRLGAISAVRLVGVAVGGN